MIDCFEICQILNEIVFGMAFIELKKIGKEKGEPLNNFSSSLECLEGIPKEFFFLSFAKLKNRLIISEESHLFSFQNLNFVVTEKKPEIFLFNFFLCQDFHQSTEVFKVYSLKIFEFLYFFI